MTLPTAAVDKLDFDEIQGIILSGYGHLMSSTNLLITIEDEIKAKDWIAHLEISNAAPWPMDANGHPIRPSTAVSIAFSKSGLDKLHIPMDGFSFEFKEGITDENRLRRLGDTGKNALDQWEFGRPGQPTIDVLLMLFALDNTGLQTLKNAVLPRQMESGVRLIHEEASYRPEHSREPFGFLDGLSQPVIKGARRSVNDVYAGTPPINAGEFILGYYNQYNVLPPTPTHQKLKKNGSYLVLRKLEQDVAGFWNYIVKQAHEDPFHMDYLSAKLVGRWRSGAPLTLAPEADDVDLANDYDRNNTFHFSGKDGFGDACPVGSHIRRTNPRDSLGSSPDTSQDAVSKHRLIRRGRIYGPRYPEDVLQHLIDIKKARNLDHFEDDTGPKGLILAVIMADIKRQFEFVQQTWVNDPKFNGLYDSRDPLLGNPYLDTETTTMTVQRFPIRKQLEDVPHLVTVKGGAYFFLPSMTGIKFIAGKA